MEADPTEIGAESIVLQNQLSLAYTRDRPNRLQADAGADPDICRYTQPSYQELNKYAYTRHSSGGGKSTATDKFRCLYLREDPAPADVRNHLLAGIALSDLYCDTYFRRIARRWNERLFLRNTTNDVGAAVSAILGLAKAGSGITGGVGAGFGLADGAFRNYDNVFVVSPDLPAMQNLVKENQKRVREEALAAGLTDFYSAQSRIIEYARLCSYTGMKGLLNQAVDNTINAMKGPAGVRDAIVAAATSESAQSRAIAERRAADAKAELEAIKAEKAAKKAAEEAKKPDKPPATSGSGETTPNPIPPTPPGG